MSAATIRAYPFARPGPLEPPPEYARLRAEAPLSRVTMPDGQPAWLVTRHADVALVLSDPRFGVAPPGAALPGNDSLFQDGAAHGRLRRLVSRAFTARRVEALRPRVESLAGQYVAEMAAAGPPADLVAALARPLPLTVIAELLGVRVDDRDRFGRWADAALAVVALDEAGTGEAGGDGGGDAGQAWAQLGGYVTELVAAKRADPGEDLLSALVAVRDRDDGRLSDAELVTMASALLMAGYLTTANAFSIGALELLPAGRLAGLAHRPDRLAAAVEEILRRQSGRSGEAMPRFAHEDIELYGQRIAAGERVLARIEAANRDPERFAVPDRFDPDRSPNPHLAFGHGPHHCLGAALARLELHAALGALAARLPGLRLAQAVEDVAWTGHPLDDGPAALVVTW